MAHELRRFTCKIIISPIPQVNLEVIPPPDFDASVLGDVHVMDRRVMPDGTFECEIVVTPPGHLSQRFIGDGGTRTAAFADAVWWANEWLEAQDGS